MKQLDARGQACPVPVVRAKKALSAMGEGTLEVLVDDEGAMHNLEALARALKLSASAAARGEDGFAVTFSKGAPIGGGAEAGGDAASRPQGALPATGPAVAVIPSEFMGSGDDDLGAMLMQGFLFALAQLDEAPRAVLLYNGGVKLACAGSSSLDDLRALEEAGAKIMSCAACLTQYGLSDRLEVGEVTNMYAIVEEQMGASRIIRP